MSIFAMADTHLSLSNPDKSMTVFGSGWNDYINRMEKGWKETVTDEDTVLIAGDISWATYIDKAREDFEFLNSLPGKKILSRGNHDYWWTTISKMEKLLDEWGMDKMSFARTNAVSCEGALITGTRGWYLNTNTEEDRKIYQREIQRTGLAIKELDKEDPERQKTRIFMIHYPPLTCDMLHTDFTNPIEEGGVDICIFGHLHGTNHRAIAKDGNGSNTRYICTSSDYLNFTPVKIL